MKKTKHSILMEEVKNSNERFERLSAEQRSNILLNSGDHYSKRNSTSFSRIRNFRHLNEEQKIRIVANHTQAIIKLYVNGVLSLAPGVTITPKNPKELEDKKSAELNKAVWEDAVYNYKLTNEIQNWINDFFVIGECAVLIRFNPSIGKFIGYKQALDEQGNPAFDEQGEMKASKEGQMEGDFEFVRIFGFNLILPDGAMSVKTSPWVGHKELVSNEVLKNWLSDYPEKLEKFNLNKTKDGPPSSRFASEFYTFDHDSFNYEYQKNHTIVYSKYYRPCEDYPKGYYYIFTDSMILFKGELPYGIFPIIYEGCDEIQTSPRHRSLIKIMRPYQVEINRALSKIAEHQITLGDDKVFLQTGTKMQNSVTEPGIRAYNINGRPPDILQGRVGDQYLPNLQFTIENMYRCLNVEFELQKGKGANIGGDGGFGFLFMSMSQKKPFMPYAKKIENMLAQICETFLKLAKKYYDEDRLIKAAGMDEAVNIAEFKKTTDLSYLIKVEPSSNDLESMFGRQLAINHALQYTGGNLPPEEIGKFIKNMPFANFEDNFKSLTQNEDSANNLILALERGEEPQPNQYDDHVFMINKLVARVRDPSFKLLDPQIQQMFFQYIQGYQQLEAQNQEKIKAMQNEFIPVDSNLVKVDVYVPKKGSKNPNAVERATLPHVAIVDLMKKLEAQGYSQERLNSMNPGAKGQIAGMVTGGPGGPPQGPGGPPQGGIPPQGGLGARPQGGPPQGGGKLPSVSQMVPPSKMAQGLQLQGLLKGF